MNELNYLLYIIASSISNPSPKLISQVRDLVASNHPNWFEKVSLNPNQRKKAQQLMNEHPEEKYQETLTKTKISIVNFLEPNFPSLLLQIPDHPLLLYYRGNLSAVSNQCLAIVGSRKQTSYSTQVIDKILSNISSEDLTIISGLAFGVDSTAHKVALDNNIKTVAVLATGVDDESIYPKSNLKLSHTIIKNCGLLLSEYPPYAPAQPYQFVARNRIIAGICKATAIIEAAEKSGSLITADFASDYNRTIFAVPGSIFTSSSRGTNDLIKKGAEVLTCPEDIVNYFELTPKHFKQSKSRKFTERELRVLEYIKQPISFDELLESCSLPHSELQATLMQLEIDKIISESSPQTFERIS